MATLTDGVFNLFNNSNQHSILTATNDKFVTDIANVQWNDVYSAIFPSDEITLCQTNNPSTTTIDNFNISTLDDFIKYLKYGLRIAYVMNNPAQLNIYVDKNLIDNYIDNHDQSTDRIAKFTSTGSGLNNANAKYIFKLTKGSSNVSSTSLKQIFKIKDSNGIFANNSNVINISNETYSCTAPANYTFDVKYETSYTSSGSVIYLVKPAPEWTSTFKESLNVSNTQQEATLLSPSGSYQLAQSYNPTVNNTILFNIPKYKLTVTMKDLDDTISKSSYVEGNLSVTNIEYQIQTTDSQIDHPYIKIENNHLIWNNTDTESTKTFKLQAAITYSNGYSVNLKQDFIIPAAYVVYDKYWYIGTTNPSTINEVSTDLPANDNSSAGWRRIGTTLPTYDRNNMLWNGDTNNITLSDRIADYYLALPSSSIKIYDTFGGNVMEGYTSLGTQTISNVTYAIYKCNTKAKLFTFNIY